jgi:hypothetical protein
VICNGRKLLLEPEWTRRPSLQQISVIVMDVQLKMSRLIQQMLVPRIIF